MFPMSVLTSPTLSPAEAPRTLPRNSDLAPGLHTAGDGEACDGDVTCTPIEGPTTLFAEGEGDGNAIDINDVNQRGFNDCYLMAAIGSLAATEDGRARLHDMITDNGDGTYTVTFRRYDDGGWFGIGSGWDDVEITVNGDFPQQASALSGDVNANGEQEIWPQVLEKAYAQFIGGYSEFDADHNGDGKADGGNPGTALEAFTGRHAERPNPQDYSIEDLNADFESGQPITLLSPGGDKHGNLEGEAAEIAGDYGLHGFHSYAVMDVDVETGMVTLYNPWGLELEEPVQVPWSEAQKFFIEAATIPQG
jgi:hypothetical protein